ncbi:MAG: hypothetical protein WHX52_23255 [Anaerolineae bacterium]
MATDKFTPEAREVLVRCYRYLLQLAEDEGKCATSSCTSYPQTDQSEENGSDSSKEADSTNETA